MAREMEPRLPSEGSAWRPEGEKYTENLHSKVLTRVEA